MKIGRHYLISLGVILLALFSAVLSYWKFSRCAPGGWASPDVYQRDCYTDITSLYHSRHFAIDAWPYGAGTHSLEYPVLTGLGIWLISLITPNGLIGLHKFFVFNIAVIAFFHIVIAFILAKFDRRSAIIYALSPAVIYGLFINWDTWGIVAMVASLYAFQQNRIRLSGIALAIGISLKFFPVLLVIPFILHLRKEKRAVSDFLATTIISLLVINLPFILSHFDGWAKFFIFNYKRGVDYGSIWYLLSLKGSWISNLNEIATPLVALLIALACYRYRDNYRTALFLSAVIFFTLNKVYSPQYVLWLTPLALLCIPKTRTFLMLFAVWQGSELLYQHGIWRHILALLNKSGGISTNTYIEISTVRIIALLALAGYALYQAELLKDNFIESSRSKSNS